MISMTVAQLLELARVNDGGTSAISRFLSCGFSHSAGWDNRKMPASFAAELKTVLDHRRKLVEDAGGDTSADTFPSESARDAFEAALAKVLTEKIDIKGRMVEPSEILGGTLSPNDSAKLAGLLIRESEEDS
jgi:hypothetical protein